MTARAQSPPVVGLRVLELQSIGPGPRCGMMLSDLGGEVLRIDREGNGWPNRSWTVGERDGHWTSGQQSSRAATLAYRLFLICETAQTTFITLNDRHTKFMKVRSRVLDSLERPGALRIRSTPQSFSNVGMFRPCLITLRRSEMSNYIRCFRTPGALHDIR
jgi:hypothetical protein